MKRSRPGRSSAPQERLHSSFLHQPRKGRLHLPTKKHAGACFFVGAGGRARTGTDFTPRDFKSLVSANSTTPAGMGSGTGRAANLPYPVGRFRHSPPKTTPPLYADTDKKSTFFCAPRDFVFYASGPQRTGFPRRVFSAALPGLRFYGFPALAMMHNARTELFDLYKQPKNKGFLQKSLLFLESYDIV